MKAIFSKGDKPFENRQTYPYEMNINYSIYNLYDVGNINLSFVPSFTALHYIITCKCHVFSFRKYSLKSLKLLCWTFHYRQKMVLVVITFTTSVTKYLRIATSEKKRLLWLTVWAQTFYLDWDSTVWEQEASWSQCISYQEAGSNGCIAHSGIMSPTLKVTYPTLLIFRWPFIDKLKG